METTTTKYQERHKVILALNKQDLVVFGAIILCFIGGIISAALDADFLSWLAGIAGVLVLARTLLGARNQAQLVENFNFEIKKAQNELERFENISKQLKGAETADETSVKNS